MAQQTYTLVLTGTMTALGTITLTHDVPTNQSLTLKNLIVQKEGDFNITDIRDNGSQHFTNASQSTPIPSDCLVENTNDYHGVNPFHMPMLLQGGNSIYIDLIDTSNASNEVFLIIECIREFK